MLGGSLFRFSAFLGIVEGSRKARGVWVASPHPRRAGQAVGGDLGVWCWVWGVVGVWGLFGVGRGGGVYRLDMF
jgi:hypothetical protein